MIQIYFSFVVMLASIFLCIFDRISRQFFVRLLFLCPCCLVCSAHFSSSMDFHICILWALSMLCYVKALCLLVSYWCAASLSLAYLRLIRLRFWFFLFVVFIFFCWFGYFIPFRKAEGDATNVIRYDCRWFFFYKLMMVVVVMLVHVLCSLFVYV